MIEAIGWLILAVIITIISKIVAKKIFPDDWLD